MKKKDWYQWASGYRSFYGLPKVLQKAILLYWIREYRLKLLKMTHQKLIAAKQPRGKVSKNAGLYD